jgi:hypothetical protein
MKKDALSYDAGEKLDSILPLARLLANVDDKTIVNIIRAFAEVPVSKSWQERNAVHAKLDPRLVELLEAAGKLDRSPWQYFAPKKAEKKPAPKPRAKAKPAKKRTPKPRLAKPAAGPPTFGMLKGPNELNRPRKLKPAATPSPKPPAAQGMRQEEAKDILEALKNASTGLSLSDLQTRTQLDPATIKSRLKSLKREARVCCSGTRRNGLWHAGSVPPATASSPSPRRGSSPKTQAKPEPGKLSPLAIEVVEIVERAGPDGLLEADILYHDDLEDHTTAAIQAALQELDAATEVVEERGTWRIASADASPKQTAPPAAARPNGARRKPLQPGLFAD